MFFFFFHYFLLYTVLPDLGLSLVAIIPAFLNADTCHKSLPPQSTLADSADCMCNKRSLTHLPSLVTMIHAE